MKKLPYLLTMFSIIFLDQLTKYIVIEKIPLGTSIPVWGDLLRLTHVQNTGAAFSFSLGSVLLNKILFSTITVLVTIYLFYCIFKSHEKWMNFVYSLIIGGAIGNLIDRLRLGAVTDFLDADFPDFILYRWPVFNVADSAIVVAVSLFVMYEFFIKNKQQKDVNSEDK